MQMKESHKKKENSDENTTKRHDNKNEEALNEHRKKNSENQSTKKYSIKRLKKEN